ncbi:DUF4232 domain-containing protein [Ferrimicrobium acidiphilum]|jgi:predicted small secreted protein|uniref:DUF4232 domain-containing protein n=1 Tax=Ferrimicrobium acidiphilum TaxID=121039 RepID=UPI0023EFE842|nr:DUF4232 domain-containing protein [Ferrimicrobium acidiphilum]
MKSTRLPKLFISVLLTAIVLASCSSTAKGSGITVSRHGVSSVRITKSVLTRRYLVIRGTCYTTGSTPAAPAIKFHVSLAHQQVGATAWECKKPRASFSFYLPSKDLSSNEELHIYSLPESKWVIEISGSNTKGSSKEFTFYSTYVPPKPKPPVLPASAPLCSPGQVSVGITGIGDEADLVNAYLTVSDTSSSPCSLRGWPTIDGVTATKESIPAVRQHAMGPNGNILAAPSLIIIKKGVQAAYSQVTFQPDCLGGNKGVTVEKNFTSLSVTLPENLGTYSIASSAFNQGSVIQTPDSCYYTSGKLFYGTIYTFFVPSFGEPSSAL